MTPTDAERPRRPTALDQTFLELEASGGPPLHIGFAIELGGAPPEVALLRAMVARGIGAAPQLQQRLVRDPLTTAQRWIDDPWFDAGAHVDELTIDDATDGEAIDALITRLFERRLPRDRPLWRMQAIGDHERMILAGQLHHVIADGHGTIALALALMAGALSPQRPAVDALPPVSLLEGVHDDLAGLTRTLRGFGAFRELLAATGPIAERLRSGSEQDSGAGRTVLRGTVPLDPLLEGVRASNATVTAALLVAASRALRHTALLDLDDPFAFVPLNARTAGPADATANPLSVIYAALPQQRSRNAALRTAAAELRMARPAAGAMAHLSRRADDFPAATRGPLLRAVGAKMMAPVVVTSIPGPAAPIELAGRQVLGAWGWPSPGPGQALVLSALSYAGTLHLTVVVDDEAIPDAAGALAAIEAELLALSA